MVSVRIVTLLVLLASLAGAAERTLFQIGLDISHSPQLSAFYQDILTELEFHRNGDLNDDDNQTLLYRNSSTESTLFINFSYWGGEWGRLKFTPVIASDIGYKRLKYQSWSWNIIYPDGSYSDMMKWKFLLGFVPEIRFTSGELGTFHSLVIKPEIKMGPLFLTGSLNGGYDGARLLVMRTGSSFAWESGKIRSGECRAFSLGLGVFYEKVLRGDRLYGAIYGRKWDRRITYPENSVHFALTVGYSFRRLGRSK